MTDRERIVAEALSRIGQGPKSEWHGQQWCGRFVLDVYQSCGFGHDLVWPTGYSLCHVPCFVRTTEPKPGDFAVQDQAPWHHIMFVGDDQVVAGNGAGNKVYTGAKPLHGYTWYSIEALEAVS